MDNPSDLRQQRLQKLSEWENLGFGYAEKFDRSHSSKSARELVADKTADDTHPVLGAPKNVTQVCGRIVNFREIGKLSFLRIRDTEGDLQICLQKDILGEKYKTFTKLLDLGDFCGFGGEMFITKHGEPTLLAVEVTPLAKAIRPMPEKFHGVVDDETRYRQRYLELSTDEHAMKRFRVRSGVVKGIRNFFEERGFMEVETRILQPQAGGAMAKVFETHHNALDHDFVLRISLELELKMLVGGGIERVFEIGKCFRNEGIDPSHLQEFTLLEWYAAYANLEQNMAWTEDMLRKIIQETVGTTQLKVWNHDGEQVSVDFGQEWKRVRFPDLIQEFAGFDMTTATREEIITHAQKYGLSAAECAKTSTGNLLDHIYKKTARPTLIQPTFVMDYPSDVKPLARPKGDGTADCYQLLIAGWEVVNAYGELVDPRVQRKLLEEQAAAKKAGDEEAMDVDEDFLTAMEHGFPPMTGTGIGIDRLVALLTEQDNLKETIFFPLLRPRK